MKNTKRKGSLPETPKGDIKSIILSAVMDDEDTIEECNKPESCDDWNGGATRIKVGCDLTPSHPGDFNNADQASENCILSSSCNSSNHIYAAAVVGAGGTEADSQELAPPEHQQVWPPSHGRPLGRENVSVKAFKYETLGIKSVSNSVAAFKKRVISQPQQQKLISSLDFLDSNPNTSHLYTLKQRTAVGVSGLQNHLAVG
jgi:hypothetical protein